ncbi:MAG: ThuA domain-containing protein [Alphaproteobacteria bacterium]|nr:ThuA domain-containing protein [Alphaproteobacteria bacterium]
MSSKAPIRFYLVAAGKYHDIDYARLELLKLLAEDERYRVSVAPDYSDIEGIQASDVLITYTCDLTPTPAQVKGLNKFLSDGGKWFALHGTNSILRFLDDGRVDSPDLAPEFMELLGSQFIAHPPIQPYQVEVSQGAHDHPLVQGIEPFEVDDELYCSKYIGENKPFLETRWSGKCEGFVEEDWTDTERHLVMYSHHHGSGEVLYLTLGHCRGKYDMQPMIEEYPQIERGSWDQPVFYDLLRRGIKYLTGELS